MVVMLPGVIGGMLMAGIIGLFLGVVVLTHCYKLFIAWLNLQLPAAEDSSALAAGAE